MDEVKKHHGQRAVSILADSHRWMLIIVLISYSSLGMLKLELELNPVNLKKF